MTEDIYQDINLLDATPEQLIDVLSDIYGDLESDEGEPDCFKTLWLLVGILAEKIQETDDEDLAVTLDREAAVEVIRGFIYAGNKGYLHKVFTQILSEEVLGVPMETMDKLMETRIETGISLGHLIAQYHEARIMEESAQDFGEDEDLAGLRFGMVDDDPDTFN